MLEVGLQYQAPNKIQYHLKHIAYSALHLFHFIHQISELSAVFILRKKFYTSVRKIIVIMDISNQDQVFCLPLYIDKKIPSYHNIYRYIEQLFIISF